MVELSVYPFLDDLLHVPEIKDHSAFVEAVGFELDLDLPVMPVGMGAFAIIVEQAMAVAEMDFFQDFIQSSVLRPPPARFR